MEEWSAAFSVQPPEDAELSGTERGPTPVKVFESNASFLERRLGSIYGDAGHSCSADGGMAWVDRSKADSLAHGGLGSEPAIHFRIPCAPFRLWPAGNGVGGRCRQQHAECHGGGNESPVWRARHAGHFAG